LEARKLGIPIIGVVDTNNNPNDVDYVIPGNDDAIRAIQLYTRAVADAVLEGRASVPQVQGDDEFIELDKDGNPVERKAKQGKKKSDTKSAPKKKAAAKKTVAKKAEEKPEADKPAEAVEKPAKEATKKKTAAKKTVTKKASDEEE